MECLALIGCPFTDAWAPCSFPIPYGTHPRQKHDVWAASALWITRKLYAKSHGRPGMPIYQVVSNLFTLHNSTRPHDYFTTDRFPHFLEAVHAFAGQCPMLDGPECQLIQGILERTLQTHRTLRASFLVLEELFPLLYRRDPLPPPPPTSALNGPPAGGLARLREAASPKGPPMDGKLSQYGELHYFTWLLFLYARENLCPGPLTDAQQVVLLRMLVLFATTQPELGRTTVREGRRVGACIAPMLEGGGGGWHLLICHAHALPWTPRTHAPPPQKKIAGFA